MQMQLKWYMAAVSFMTPPHNGLDTPWPKFMLDSPGLFLHLHIHEVSPSYISTWQPYTWTFVGTWRRAASLAAGEGRLFFLACRWHPSILLLERERRWWWIQPTSLSDARRAGRQRISCTVPAFNLLLWISWARLYQWYVLWYLMYGTLLTWNHGEDYINRSTKGSDGVISRVHHSRCRHLKVEQWTRLACLERQWIVAHRKSSNFKNVRKLRTSKIVWDGTNDRLSPIMIMMMYIEWKTLLEAINKYDDERNETKFMCSPYRNVNNASISHTTRHRQLKLVRPPGKQL